MTAANLTVFNEVFQETSILTGAGNEWIIQIILIAMISLLISRRAQHWAITALPLLIITRNLGMPMHAGLFYSLSSILIIMFTINTFSVAFITQGIQSLGETISKDVLTYDNALGRRARKNIYKKREKSFIESDIAKYGENYALGKNIRDIKKKIEQQKYDKQIETFEKENLKRQVQGATMNKRNISLEEPVIDIFTEAQKNRLKEMPKELSDKIKMRAVNKSKIPPFEEWLKLFSKKKTKMSNEDLQKAWITYDKMKNRY